MLVKDTSVTMSMPLVSQTLCLFFVKMLIVDF